MLKLILERYQKNWHHFINDFRIWLIFVLLAGSADMVSTIYFMLDTGPEGESHPAVRIVCYLFGPIIGPFIGKLCQFIAILAVTVYFRRQAIYVFIAVIILYFWAAWYNVWGCQLYYPRLLRIIEYLPI